jgi:glutamate synthase (NADPH/NADH) small chain
MSKHNGFLEFNSELPPAAPVEDRIKHSKEFIALHPDKKIVNQAARCMDCGIPFCHNGCPLGNIIPEFNDAVYRQDWLEAYNILSQTNNFPEFTGRICPAPCESACVLGINQSPVVIEAIEKHIIEIAFSQGYVKAKIPQNRTKNSIAIIGSGPTGLAAAAELNKLGHNVVVFEKNKKVGGLLRYGIPDFKLEKEIIDRRIELMQEEGIVFNCETTIGKDILMDDLLRDYDAVILCGGSEEPRDLVLPGRSLCGVHFAMDYLTQHNKKISNEDFSEEFISAKNKNVIIIGSGDTASDCIGTANRQGAKTIVQIGLSSKPPLTRTPDMPWPTDPKIYKVTSSHEEGCERKWELLTKGFMGDTNGKLTGVVVNSVEWKYMNKKPQFIEKSNSENIILCDLAIIAVGFANPIFEGMLEDCGVELDAIGNVQANTINYQTSIPKIFAAGDIRRGQSLVVWAIKEGRDCALAVNKFLSDLK